MAGAPPRQSGPGRGPDAQARDRPRQPDRREGGTPREPRAHRRTGRAADGRAPTPRSVRHSTGRARRRAREALSARANRRARTAGTPQGEARGRKRPGQGPGQPRGADRPPRRAPPKSAQIKARPTGRGYRLVAEGGTAGGFSCPRGPGGGRGAKGSAAPRGRPKRRPERSAGRADFKRTNKRWLPGRPFSPALLRLRASPDGLSNGVYPHFTRCIPLFQTVKNCLLTCTHKLCTLYPEVIEHGVTDNTNSYSQATQHADR